MNELKKYFKKIDSIYHLTFDPYGPGVIRIYLIPPKKVKFGIPWVVLINGQDLLPISTGWGILLKEFIENATAFEGKSLTDEDINDITFNTVKNMSKIFPKTDKKLFKDDLKAMIFTFKQIAKGEEPNENIGLMKLADYAKYMKAPHRMDLMISSMEKNGTWHCNQKCINCYAGTQKLAVTSELDTKSWKIIIDRLKEAGVPQLTFTGGEPTLRSDLVELIEYSKWFVTRLNTNGVLLNDQLCKDLVAASLDSVQVTLYSASESIHNFLVGTSNYQYTIEGIKNALNAGLNLSINTPLVKLNKDYLSLIRYCVKLGVRYFTCSGIIKTGNALDNADAYLSKEELLEILTEVSCLQKELDFEISFTSPGWIDEKSLKELHLTPPMCGANLSNMAINPSGEVIPCQSFLSDSTLGNLLTTNFKKIWNNKKAVKLRKEVMKLDNLCMLNNRNKEL